MNELHSTRFTQLAVSLLSAALLLSASQSFANSPADPKTTLHLDMLHEMSPDLELISRAKVTTHLADYRGKQVILHFWASWCEPCKKELAELNELAKAGAANGVILVPVSGDDSTKPKQVKDAQGFLASVPGNLPFFIAGQGSGRDRFLTWGLPVTYFIDRSGKLIARALGPRAWDAEPDLSGLLQRLFNSK